MAALGDIQSTILAFVNDALNEAYSGTQLDIAIQACLNDLSNEDILVATDTSQSLTSSSVSLNYPTDFKGLISIVLINSSSVRQAPLIKLRGGHKEYRRLRDNDSATGEPEHYSEFDNKFWLWRPSNGAYTTEIEYYRKHPQTPADILFGEECRNAINFGTTYYKALLAKKTDYIRIWQPIWLAEKLERAAAANAEPRICGD